MPRISEFYGIAIYMYYRDHPPPHFRAIYGDFEATISIAAAAILEGQLPPKALSMVCEWAALHRTELEDNWGRARSGDPLVRIFPLQ